MYREKAMIYKSIFYRHTAPMRDVMMGPKNLSTNGYKNSWKSNRPKPSSLQKKRHSLNT